MRDLVSRVSVSTPHFPAVLTATPTAVAVDRRGFESVTFVIDAGIGGITFTGTNRIDWTMMHSDDGSTWTNVTTGDVRSAAGGQPTISNGIVESYVAAKAAVSTTEYGYVGDKRFARLTPVFGGTHATGTLLGSKAILGHPANAPVA
jgi:hypothetical protein